MKSEQRLIDANVLSEELSSLRITITGGRYRDKAVEEAQRQYRESVLRIIDEQATVKAIAMPCEVGDDVYIVKRYRDGTVSHIVEKKCTGVHVTKKVFGYGREREKMYLVTNSDIGHAEHIPFREIGKTVFFTREEAVSATRRMCDEK